MTLTNNYSEKYITDKIIRFGAETLTNKELLQFILTTKVSQISVKNVIKDFFDEHQRLNELQFFSDEGLKNLCKDDEKVAIIRALREFSERYKEKEGLVLGQIFSSCMFGNYMIDKIGDSKQELLVCVCLDTKNQVLSEKVIFKGTLNSATVHPREIFKHALNFSCARILVAHNHPSGNVEPSENDIQLTKRLINAGKMIGIELIDHVIVGSEVYLSLAEEKIVEF
ncbi:RadC family protein [Ligilactobacillus salivarius]|uniref:RadC family protein n=1 Tax=Ligilactobacillus salivarius TaxID=1624 RepID=UPI0009DB3ECC|nr:DNA repair protein RadC [Ligilactobacillus salivarius]MDL1930217.1 DNA repair protein RadC [Ligilactobacillus salivarius]MYU74276.1 DNA repair protein RadC [Ligilactobacillus salivarius]MYU79528.1 DNA repair protein RadC [Ligilactobacillus salivarius]MYV06584.1 DNA repair protein RadC [Ligilactobacillus salivarius]MYV14066.1 DNA repair protein RadC [Ligilactobacillus salivarius]